MQKKERGRWIKGYEGMYAVSNLGRVKSVARTVMSNRGRPITRMGKILSLNTSAAGYRYISVCKDGKSRTFLIHRLVAEAFIPNPHNLPVVMHLDDVPGNNRVTNLKWGTQKTNMEDMVRKGRQPSPKGSTNGSSKLTEKDIPQIRKLLTAGWTQKRIASKFGVDQSTISLIKHRKEWAHVT